MINGLVHLTRIQIANGNLELALEYTQRWVNLDPTNEMEHRDLMQIYAWTIQSSAAIRQYREYQRILKRDLNKKPEPITSEPFTRIQSGELQHEQALALSPEMFFSWMWGKLFKSC